MHIQKLHLKNFKRFTDLTIDGIPDNTKLVLLIGANGSGKSSVFDAFEVLNSYSKPGFSNHNLPNSNYYQKTNKQFQIVITTPYGTLNTEEENSTMNSTMIYTLKDNDVFKRLSFYGRTSFRQISKLTKTILGNNLDIQNDSDRPRLYIDKDERFENDIEKITEDILKNVFSTNDSSKQIKQKYIEPINESLQNIFSSDNNTSLELIEIIPPLEGKTAQINFKKGDSFIHYNLLSAGEKEIINILFNLLSRKDLLQDAILFFDEMDLHLNTSIQYNLLKEITEKWVPDNSQLWTASHALGFIDYARKADDAVIIDFDSLNFDIAQTLIPQSNEVLDVYDIAVPKSILSQLFKDKKVVFCENKNDEWYNLLGLKNVIFVGGKDSRDVFLHVKRDANHHALRDRDFLSDTEISNIQKAYPNYHILKYYDFENYLYHPDNIAEISPDGFDKSIYLREIIEQKNIKKDYILPILVSSRQTYEEFKTNEKLRDKDTNTIVDDFRSNDFERFYKFFDMKGQFDKVYLQKFNIKKETLVTTKWFKTQIKEILES